VTLDHEDIAAIADAVETGVTRSRNKFIEEFNHTLLLYGGMAVVGIAVYQWGGTALGYVWAFFVFWAKHPH
jgi:hypothetical protein